MKRMIAVSSLALLLATAACNKPTNEECRQAIEHMRTILGTENATTDIPGQVRHCRSGSKREAVQCAIAAKNRAELEACHLVPHEDPDPPAPPEPGSGSGSGSN